MAVFISLLRGINVGGKRSLKMRDLEELYHSLGFEAVKSYLQSGNLVFRAAAGPAGLGGKIGKAIEQKAGLEVEVLVLSAAELKKIAKENPFVGQPGVDEGKLHVTFFSVDPGENAVRTVARIDAGPDRFAIKGKAAYLYCPGGYGRTKLSNTFFENKLKLKATTRNWRTVLALVDMVGSD